MIDSADAQRKLSVTSAIRMLDAEQKRSTRHDRCQITDAKKTWWIDVD